jgi:hypothetical protein
VRIIAQGQFDVNQENIEGLALSSILLTDLFLVSAGQAFDQGAKSSGGTGRSVWFILLIWLIWFIRLVSFNQTNKTNQINQITIFFRRRGVA